MYDHYDIHNTGSDIWCTYIRNHKAFFEFRIGGGGAIAELRLCDQGHTGLLSPTYAGEHTDRIIQTTWWLNSLKNNQNGDKEKRWNVTQGGNMQGVFNPTTSVSIDKKHNLIDVYSNIGLQWNNSFDTVFHGGYRMLTRYQGMAHGVISIRRIMIAQQADSAGIPKPYKNLYVEAWTPFNYSAGTFNALALSFDPSGKPDLWYRAGVDIPTYQNQPVDKTNGYAVVYNSASKSSFPFAAFIFGNKKVSYHSPAKYALNTLNWQNGIGVLPGLTFNDFMAGGVIDQTFYLYINNDLNADNLTFIKTLTHRLATVHIYQPGEIMPPALKALVNNINSYAKHSGNRTEHLASLVKSANTK